MSLQRILNEPKFLPQLLLVDGIATGATGLLLLAGAGWLEPVFALTASLLRIAGAICLVFAVWVLVQSRARPTSRSAIAVIVAINFAWVAASLWVAFGNTWQPSALGIAFVLAQALVVLVFAEAGWFGLRATRPRSAAV